MFIIDRLTSEVGCSYSQFIDLVEYLTGRVFGESLVFQRDIYSNPQNLQVPCITYRLISKQPGAIGNGVREIKPRLRETIPDPRSAGDYIRLYGQFFDYIVQFDIWASADNEADNLELRFENMMLQYMGFFIQKGVHRLYFESQLADQNAQSLRLDLSCRSVRYFVQLEQITPVDTKALREIEVHMSYDDMHYDFTIV